MYRTITATGAIIGPMWYDTYYEAVAAATLLSEMYHNTLIRVLNLKTGLIDVAYLDGKIYA